MRGDVNGNVIQRRIEGRGRGRKIVNVGGQSPRGASFMAAMATRPEPVARSIHGLAAHYFCMVEHITGERLASGPGKGPEGRWKAHFTQLVFRLLPEGHRLMGEMQS